MRFPLKDVCYGGSKRCERMREDFEAVDAALKKKYRAVYDVHYFLERNGLRDALRGNTPTRTRGAVNIITPTTRTFQALATGDRPLIKSFKAVSISGGKVYGNPESLTLLQGWSDDWKEKKDLERSIGCPLSELEMATVDASDLVKVAGSRPWESETVPKKRTTENKHGEPVRKKLRDEGKKPATCTACGHPFLSSSTTFKNGGHIRCPLCGAYKAKYD